MYLGACSGNRERPEGVAEVAGVLLTVSVPYKATEVFDSLLVLVYSEPMWPLCIPTLQGEKVLPRKCCAVLRSVPHTALASLK